MRTAASVCDTVETFEKLGQLVGRDADPGVADGELDMRAGVTQSNLDETLEGKLEGVRDEIEDDLFPHLPIDIRQFGHGRTVNVEPQSGPLNRRAKNARKLSGES